MRYEFSSEVTRWSNRDDSWYFAHVPPEQSEDLRALPIPRRGFGSLRVRVTLGSTTWTTSVFPDGDGRYSLPLKREVRRREAIEPGDVITLGIELLDLA